MVSNVLYMASRMMSERVDTWAAFGQLSDFLNFQADRCQSLLISSLMSVFTAVAGICQHKFGTW